ncbi:hypothetical protein KI809_10665 [Geobacter pelophilus]|uniref:Uncharacterized protein n=1 Tax=Geoanaerobacter pelophilus TaxID=60036 RepID=A0AAW4LA78_9BACT|nr:hypothetical protein [Geoanaerobacter pelophilus]MBT0664762.1 hypothetical protein [Geoanaerobacter pelophilus]
MSLVIIWACLALQCSRFQDSPGTCGVIYNRANGSITTVWNYSNASIYLPIWNPANPSFVPCSSYTGPNLPPEGAAVNLLPDTVAARMTPYCWTCHGEAAIWRYGDANTGMAFGNGNPVGYR